MYIGINTIITIASVMGAIISIGGILIACYKWFSRQNKQDEDIKVMKSELWLLTYNMVFDVTWVVYLIALIGLSWLCAMVGYDKVIQALSQIRSKS